jgi:hypothetical protein
MRRIEVSIVRGRTSVGTIYSLILEDPMNRPSISRVWSEIRTEQNIILQLKSLLPLTDLETQKIVADLSGPDSKYIGSHSVDETTYQRVFR